MRFLTLSEVLGLHREQERFMLALAAGEISREQLVKWLGRMFRL